MPPEAISATRQSDTGRSSGAHGAGSVLCTQAVGGIAERVVGAPGHLDVVHGDVWWAGEPLGGGVTLHSHRAPGYGSRPDRPEHGWEKDVRRRNGLARPKAKAPKAKALGGPKAKHLVIRRALRS